MISNQDLHTYALVNQFYRDISYHDDSQKSLTKFNFLS